MTGATRARARGRAAWAALAASLLSAAPGCECARSHTLAARDAEADAAVSDAAVSDARVSDARVSDAGADPSRDAARACPGPTPRALAVRADGTCALGPIEGLLRGPVREAPEVDGVALAIDACVEPERDCACTIVIEGVGVEMASRTLLDRGPVRIEAGPTRIVVVGSHGGGEAGAYDDLVGLYAESGPLDAAVLALDGISIASAPSCTEIEGACTRRRHDAIVTMDARAAGWEGWTEGGSVRLAEGELARVSGTFASVRLVTARDERCDGAAAPPPHGAWAIAWLYPPAP